MRYILFVLLLLGLSDCATPSRFYDTTTGLSTSSSDVIYGVRFYEGKLPNNIRYEFLGQVDACGTENFSIPSLRDARSEMAQKAKKMGANAIINVQSPAPWGEMCLEAQAVKVKEFPDTLQGVIEESRNEIAYRNSRVFDADYAALFDSAKNILESELFDFKVCDTKNGILETEAREMIPDRMRWRAKNLGGPYPVLTIKIIVKKISGKKTEVTRIDTFHGAALREKTVKQNSSSFFAEIAQNLHEM
jgi:uncharacterized protein YbjQ (UPF0145 family)